MQTDAVTSRARSPLANETICPTIRAFLKRWYDAAETAAVQRTIVRSLAIAALESRRPGAELPRAWMIVDWELRVRLALVLRLSGQVALATSLSREFPVSSREQILALYPFVRKASLVANDVLQRQHDKVSRHVNRRPGENAARKVTGPSIGATILAIEAESAGKASGDAHDMLGIDYEPQLVRILGEARNAMAMMMSSAVYPSVRRTAIGAFKRAMKASICADEEGALEVALASASRASARALTPFRSALIESAVNLVHRMLQVGT